MKQHTNAGVTDGVGVGVSCVGVGVGGKEHEPISITNIGDSLTIEP